MIAARRSSPNDRNDWSESGDLRKEGALARVSALLQVLFLITAQDNCQNLQVVRLLFFCRRSARSAISRQHAHSCEHEFIRAFPQAPPLSVRDIARAGVRIPEQDRMFQVWLITAMTSCCT